jgi:hypothetical protein
VGGISQAASEFALSAQIPQSDLSHGDPKGTERIFYEADRADRTFTCGVKRIFVLVAGFAFAPLWLDCVF